MTGKNEEQMIHKLGPESIGGNAGKDQGKPCIGANFWFEDKMGKS